MKSVAIFGLSVFVHCVREAIKKNSLNTGIARKGGGFNPCPNVFRALFMDLYIWAKCQKGGVEGLAKRFGSLLKVLYC